MKTILLIEDDTALRENTAELLELSGYNVETAPNGKVGIEKAGTELPDIIVCDIMMPECDGYAVLNANYLMEKLKEIGFTLPFDRTCMHEFVAQPPDGLRTLDIAKAQLEPEVMIPSDPEPVVPAEQPVESPEPPQAAASADPVVEPSTPLFRHDFPILGRGRSFARQRL